MGLEGKRLDSGCEVMGPGGEVERAVERSAFPGGDDAMDAGIGSDGGIGGRVKRDKHEGYDSGDVSLKESGKECNAYSAVKEERMRIRMQKGRHREKCAGRDVLMVGVV